MMDANDVAKVRVWRKPKGVSGKLCTADTAIILHMIWNHDVIYTPSGQLAIYDQMPWVAWPS